ncbi:MAG TPA: hypothetical protein VFB79_15505, partial [Candidatus Angelobacter sp.]|nr:hypothetical protein [Candidatus Angelobacter sp.]
MVSIYSDTNAKVVVETFTRQRDGEDIIIGRPEVGSFLAIPSEAIDALDLLARGKTIGEVGQYYLDKDGEVPDLTEFLEMLSVHGFISTLGQDSKKNAVKSAGSRSSIRFHFASFPEELAQKIFGPATVSICIILSLVAVGLCYLDRSLIPRSSSIYFPFSRTLSIALLILEGYFALVLHEFSHLVAARAAGVDSKFGLGHRLWYIVAETDLTGLWSVPKERRYLPFLAGVLVDATSGAVLIILIFCCRRGWPPLSPFWTNLVKAMIFAYAMRIVWQCFLFVRTDFYYVIANF